MPRSADEGLRLLTVQAAQTARRLTPIRPAQILLPSVVYGDRRGTGIFSRLFKPKQPSQPRGWIVAKVLYSWDIYQGARTRRVTDNSTVVLLLEDGGLVETREVKAVVQAGPGDSSTTWGPFQALHSVTMEAFDYDQIARNRGSGQLEEGWMTRGKRKFAEPGDGLAARLNEL